MASKTDYKKLKENTALLSTLIFCKNNTMLNYHLPVLGLPYYSVKFVQETERHLKL